MNESLKTPSCGLATWSLVLGILALLLCVVGPLFGIPAVICGHLALSRIKRSGGALRGQGPAIGGLVTGYLSIAMIPVIGLLAAIAVPNFVKARETAFQNQCINNLRQIDGTKQQWALENAKQADAVPESTDLQPFLRDGLLPICPKGGTYELRAVGEEPTCSMPGHELPH